MNIYLDDERKCPNGFIPAKNYDECLDLLINNKVDILSLDHDLGEIKTGYDVVKYIVEFECYPETIYIHTANPAGRKNMYETLMHYKPDDVEVFNYPIN